MTSDIRTNRFIDALPARFRPYAILARMDRPIGIWLLLFPGLWAIALAPGGLILKLWIGFLFFIGAVVMRAAGCVVNDLWDRDLDTKVERTKGRPLAAGDLSFKQAALFLLALLLCGLLVLVQMNGMTIMLGFAVMPLVIAYPLMKRITYWPQAFLGLTFNFGALMGWSAITGSLEAPAFWLYVSGIFWTLGYDTIYAHQDKEDDALVGIKSTALKFGDQSKLWVMGFYVCAWLMMVFAALSSVPFSVVSAVVLLLPAVHLGFQVLNWNMGEPASSLDMFKSNRIYGVLVLIVFSLCKI